VQTTVKRLYRQMKGLTHLKRNLNIISHESWPAAWNRIKSSFCQICWISSFHHIEPRLIKSQVTCITCLCFFPTKLPKVS
jgi:hypothetical protein